MTRAQGPSTGRRGDGRLAQAFGAISHEVRQRILFLLQERERSVNELVREFELSQPTISRHLAVLKRAGFVQDRRVGQQVFYALDEEGIRSCLTEFFGRFRCCAPLITPTPKGQGK